MNCALKNFEFFECPKPRWESLHIIMGFAEMYLATGEEKYQKSAAQIFYSILKTDVHNTGGFSTEEMAIGHPFMNGKIELCCVIAYNALACDILKITGDIKIVDFLEKSLYNRSSRLLFTYRKMVYLQHSDGRSKRSQLSLYRVSMPSGFA